jgi:glucose dehydrogenase
VRFVMKDVSCIATTAGTQGEQPQWPVAAAAIRRHEILGLAGITRDNVHLLRPVWSWATLGRADSRGAPARSVRATPLMLGDTLYLSTPYNQVVALDATSGKSCGGTIRRRTDPGSRRTVRDSCTVESRIGRMGASAGSSSTRDGA